jgi:hypothetical protein
MSRVDIEGGFSGALRETGKGRPHWTGDIEHEETDVDNGGRGHHGGRFRLPVVRLVASWGAGPGRDHAPAGVRRSLPASGGPLRPLWTWSRHVRSGFADGRGPRSRDLRRPAAVVPRISNEGVPWPEIGGRSQRRAG